MSNKPPEELQALLPKDSTLEQDFNSQFKRSTMLTASHQIRTLQNFLRAWMAQRIILLILTGVIGYALYYYFSRSSRETRNIFSALTKVNQTIRQLPRFHDELDESSEMSTDNNQPDIASQSMKSAEASESSASKTPPLEEKPLQSLIDSPIQALLDALEKTSAPSLDLWWTQDQLLIQKSVQYWHQHTPPAQIPKLLEELTQPLKKLYRQLALRYHPDKAKQDLSEKEQLVFQQMTDYVLSIGKRLCKVSKKAGLAHQTNSQTYTDILRGFQFLHREMQDMTDQVHNLMKEMQAIKQKNEKQFQELDNLSKISKKQFQHLDQIGADYARFRQQLDELSNIMDEREKRDQMDQYNYERLRHWQNKLKEDEHNIVTVRKICFYSAYFSLTHPLINTYFPTYYARRHEDNTLNATEMIILCLIGIHYFIRTEEPECAHNLYQHIANFENKEDVQSYQSLFEQAQKKIKSIETKQEAERSTVTPM